MLNSWYFERFLSLCGILVLAAEFQKCHSAYAEFSKIKMTSMLYSLHDTVPPDFAIESQDYMKLLSPRLWSTVIVAS